MFRKTLAIAALAAAFIPPPANAITADFAFEVSLTETSCENLGFCSTPDPSATILVRVELEDPEQSQSWTATGRTNVRLVAPFPVSNCSLDGGSASGSYEFDPATGIGTAVLHGYSLDTQARWGEFQYEGDAKSSLDFFLFSWNDSTLGMLGTAQYDPEPPQPATIFFTRPDTDDDGLVDSADNCTTIANADQLDVDADGIGNRCDGDFTQDCRINFDDLAVMKAQFFAPGQLNTDMDGNGITNFADLDLFKAQFFGSPGPSGIPNICDGGAAAFIPTAPDTVRATFLFEIDLLTDPQYMCFLEEFDFCWDVGTPELSGSILVHVDLTDPYQSQSWTVEGPDNVLAFSTIPTMNAANSEGITRAQGLYEYDPVTGLGTAYLTYYFTFFDWDGDDGTHQTRHTTYAEANDGWRYQVDEPGPGRVYFPAAAPDPATILVAPPNPINASFETGDFTGWTVVDHPTPTYALRVDGAGLSPGFGFFSSSPTDGSFAALHGFDGGPGSPASIRIGQDMFVSPATTMLRADYRVAWNLNDWCVDCSDRTFRLNIYESGGGLLLESRTITVLPAGFTLLDSGDLLLEQDLSAFAGQVVFIDFDFEVPDELAGPAFLQLDNVRFEAP